MADERAARPGVSEALGREPGLTRAGRPQLSAGGRAFSEVEADAQRYRLLAEHLRVVVFHADEQGRFTFLGPAWQTLTGLSVEASLGGLLAEALHPVDREWVRMLLRALATRERESFRHEVRLLTRTGTCWVELFAHISPAASGEVMGVFADITERRRAEEAVTTRERCLAAVVEVQRRLLAHDPDGPFDPALLGVLGRAADASRVYIFEAQYDSKGRMLASQKAEWCAPGIVSEQGHPATQSVPLEEVLGPEHVTLLVDGHPLQGKREDFAPGMRQLLEVQGIHSILLLPLRVHGEFYGFIGFDDCVGARPWSALAVSLLKGASGALSLALEHRTADALRARTEATLRRTEAGLHLLMEGFPDPVLVHADSQLLYVNPALVRYLGYDGPDMLVRRPVLRLVRVEDHPQVLRHFTEAHEHLTSSRAQEVTLLRRDGQTVVADLVTLRVLFEGRPALVTVARDFTERKQMQARLMLSDRMASMGTLAAGVAHELNNPLSYVLANLDFVHGAMQPGVDVAEQLDEWREVLGEAREGAERVRQIVRQLRAFSRVDEDRIEAVDLHRVLDSVVQMAASEVRHRARLVKDYGTPPDVSGNEGKLFQVFLNLVINAAHAIPDGRVDANEIRLVTREDARGWGVVEVQDTGIGIRPEHMGRIFEPFFTTKAPGLGTGLGLSICHTIVRTLGGEISVESSLGRGTTFRVALPPAKDLPEPDEAVRPSSVAMPTRVLIVDDEPAVAAALGRMLEGHVVDVAHDGMQGLERLRSSSYDVVFCDLLMPELTGMDLYTQIVSQVPALAQRFVFITGGGFTPRAREFLDGGNHRVLDKPFSRDEVHRRVAEVLAQEL